jgi:hypothetical protein
VTSSTAGHRRRRFHWRERYRYRLLAPGFRSDGERFEAFKLFKGEGIEVDDDWRLDRPAVLAG